MNQTAVESSLADHLYFAAKDAGRYPGREAQFFVSNLLHRLNDDGHANLAARLGYFLLAHADRAATRSPLTEQVGGQHYKTLAIQPVEYIHKNGLGFCEGNAIKYLTRWKSKGGIEDLRKARHFIDLLIELETSKAGEA